MSENNILLPCPFCGCDIIEIEQYCKNGFKIVCPKCAIKREQKVLHYDLDWLKEKMIKHWNNRVKVVGK